MADKRDYYDVLGVPREASQEALKKAYRKRALENHPDRNPGDNAAERRSKEAADAYAVLSDQQKRQRYDQFGHAGLDGAAGPGGFGSVDDIFAAFGEMFGGGGDGGGFFDQFFAGGGRGRRGRRGASLKVELELSLEEVATGTKKTLDIKRPEPCGHCDGSGQKPGTKKNNCKTCGGHGEVIRNQGFFQLRQTCPSCAGLGETIEHPCPKCKGRRYQTKTAPITISIPAGIEHGHAERIHGQGEPGEGGAPAGDLVVVVGVREHKVFTRYGDDLLMQSRIAFRQAVLGDEIEIPTILDQTVTMKIPPGTQPGARLRVRNHGLPRGDGYGRGNLVVQIQIDVPSQLTSEQKELLRRFDDLEDKKQPKKGGRKTIFEKVKDIFS